MVMDLAVEIIHATVQLEQQQTDGARTVGTGFLIQAPGPDGAARTVLVTANHVFQKMTGADARIGYRTSNKDGSWQYAPKPLKIRDASGAELWTHHPTRDVAVMTIKAPEAFARAAMPLQYLAGDETFSRYQVKTGDEMMALGFPRGLSANGAGFPILRSGRVASYPLAPAKIFPTFLLDFSVFPGNSGGPVFVSRALTKDSPVEVDAVDGGGEDSGFIAGLLTQQVELNKERLEIGIVTHAQYVRETIALLQDPSAEPTIAKSGETEGARAAAAADASREE
jgi:V8-like Glu-specific endopeptidase